MPRLLFAAVLGVLLFAVSIVPATTQTPVATQASCNELTNYRTQAIVAIPGLTDDRRASVNAATGSSFVDLVGVRPVHLDVTAAFLDDYAEALESIEDVPTVVAPVHDAYITRVVLIAHLMRSFADGELLNASGYIQHIEANQQTIRDASDDAEQVCGMQWQWFASPQPAVYPLMWETWPD